MVTAQQCGEINSRKYDYWKKYMNLDFLWENYIITKHMASYKSDCPGLKQDTGKTSLGMLQSFECWSNRPVLQLFVLAIHIPIGIKHGAMKFKNSVFYKEVSYLSALSQCTQVVLHHSFVVVQCHWQAVRKIVKSFPPTFTCTDF